MKHTICYNTTNLGVDNSQIIEADGNEIKILFNLQEISLYPGNAFNNKTISRQRKLIVLKQTHHRFFFQKQAAARN